MAFVVKVVIVFAAHPILSANKGRESHISAKAESFSAACWCSASLCKNIPRQIEQVCPVQFFIGNETTCEINAVDELAV